LQPAAARSQNLLQKLLAQNSWNRIQKIQNKEREREREKRQTHTHTDRHTQQREREREKERGEEKK
jgi:hypothetical protein